MIFRILNRMWRILRRTPLLKQFFLAIHCWNPLFWSRIRVKMFNEKRELKIIPILIKRHQKVLGETRNDDDICLWVDISETNQIEYVTGIQRVVRNIVRELQNKEKLEYGFNLANLENQEICDGYKPIKPGDILLMLDSSWIAVIEGRFDAIFKSFHEAGAKIYSVVYDLTPLTLPHCFGKDFRANFKCWFHRALEESDGIICISKTIASEVAQYLEAYKTELKFQNNKLSDQKQSKLKSQHHKYRDRTYIDYWYLGSDIINLKYERNVQLPVTPLQEINEIPNEYLNKKIEFTSQNSRLDFLSDRKTFILVGTLEPRKGHAMVLDVFDALWKSGYDINLCFAGRVGWMVEALIKRIKDHSEYGKRLIFLEEAIEAELIECYKRSTALIFASKGEGFGLPIVEAAKFGLPIIASNIPIFREIGADHISYFLEGSAKSLEATIKNWLVEHEENRTPNSLMIERYSWAESAECLITKLLKRPSLGNLAFKIHEQI